MPPTHWAQEKVTHTFPVATNEELCTTGELSFASCKTEQEPYASVIIGKNSLHQSRAARNCMKQGQKEEKYANIGRIHIAHKFRRPTLPEPVMLTIPRLGVAPLLLRSTCCCRLANAFGSSTRRRPEKLVLVLLKADEAAAAVEVTAADAYAITGPCRRKRPPACLECTKQKQTIPGD